MKRASVAAILELVRGAWAAGLGASFLAVAAVFWLTSSSVDPNSSSSVLGGVLTVLVVGGFAFLGAIGLAVGIPSIAFAVLVLKGGKVGRSIALAGECFLAIVAVALWIYGLSHPSDAFPSLLGGTVILATAAPVIFLLGSELAGSGKRTAS